MQTSASRTSLFAVFCKNLIQMQEQLSVYKLKQCVQTTSLVWPKHQAQRDELSVPLSLILKPLETIEGQTPKASFSGSNINEYRCHSCKAFVNVYCTIIAENQYRCSICGCTNRISKKINSLSPELMSPVFTCKTENPSFRSNSSNYRTFIFAIDVTQYDQQTNTIVRYVSDIIHDFLKEIQQKYAKDAQKGMENNKIRIMIIGFADFIHYYKVAICDSKPNLSDQSLSSADQQVQKEPQTEQQKNGRPEQYEVEKTIQTSMKIDQEVDLLNEKDSYYLDPLKFKDKIQQILLDLMETVKVTKVSSSSNALIDTIERIMNHTVDSVGKVYVITGYRNSKGPFVESLKNQPQQFRTNFALNRNKCLSEKLIKLLSQTHMSISIFIYNNGFVNLMPLYAITKLTNGELKHYSPHNYHQLYYELYYSVCTEALQLGAQTILKARYSAGLKLVSIFGQYRKSKGAQDQVELLSCSPNRMYMFQFSIEGKIQQPYAFVQFSILWTDLEGNRIFKVITHSQKVSDDNALILDSTNYGTFNQSYLWAVLYNMDLNIRVRNLQITLQERCRKHLQALQKFKQGEADAIKKVTPYIIFTYYLMGHFILNSKYNPDRVYDKSIEARSRVMTSDVTGIYAIWPVVYSIDHKKIKVVQLRYSEIKNAEVAVVINQGDFCYVYIVSDDLRNEVIKKKMENNRLISEIVGQIQKLQSLSGVLQQIREQKVSGYMQIVLLESLQGAYILDDTGPKSYNNFISNLVS